MDFVFNFFKSVRYYVNYRKRFERIPGFPEFFDVETEKMAVSAVRALCTLGAILYLMVGAVDYLLYPENFPLFMTIRVLFAIFTLSTVPLTFTSWGKKYARNLIFMNALFGELGVSVMTSQISGWTSLYFVGNILITTALTMFIPWRPRVSFWYCTVSLVGYIFINQLYHPFSLQMLIPVVFIMINGVNAYFASLGSESSRMSQLASRLQIERANVELKGLNEAKSRFISNISHELRTPLTLIIGPLGALAKRGGGWVSQELVAAMTSNAQRLLRQVNALLDLGKIDSQEMKCLPEIGNIKELVFDLYRASVPGAHERGVRLEYQVSPDIPLCMFDFEKMETIVANLISNAIKFTPPRGTVVLSCEVRDDRVIRIGVKDTGPGIPIEEQEKIFGRFHQVDGVTKKVSKGTGLGLSVAKEFAELHGGKIWVESELGQGTQFFAEIPFIPADPTQDNVKNSDVSSQVRDEARNTLLIDIARAEDHQWADSDIAEENIRRMRERKKDKAVVLYVDDSPDLRRYVNSILGDLYTLILAQDGVQGFEEAMVHNPDLILSDVMMPKMNGFEFCRRVRHEAKLKATPFVLLTANSSLDSKLEGLADGADDYLSKPFSERELVARIKNLVNLRQQSESIRKQIDAAKKIQQALLPPMTQYIQGVTVEAVYEPSAELSGDFFDTIVSGDWVYVYLADVTGSGLPAAQVTYLVKDIFKNALLRELELDELFDVVRTRYLEYQLEYDLALQLMRVNSMTRAVEYLRSSSPNPVIVNRLGQAEDLDMPETTPISSAMSFSSHRPARVVSMKLERQSSFYCYSDGAYEFTSDSGQEYGEKRLLRTLASTHSLAWPSGLVGALRAESGREVFPKDLTILRVSIGPMSIERLLDLPH